MTALTLAFKRLIVFALVLLGVVSLITACADDIFDSDNGESLPHAQPLGPDEELPYECTNWMAQIDDTKYLSEIMIPGTHDSGADKHTSKQGAAAGSVIAQDYRISNQLKLGVRWFDIRLRYSGGDLAVHHSVYNLNKVFDDLLDAALVFLEEHKKDDLRTEIVVFMIKQEHSSEDEETFGTAVYFKLKKHGIDNFYLKNEVPTIGEARGKVVIVRRFNNPFNFDFGMQFDWTDNTKGGDFSTKGIDIYVQDHWEFMSTHYDMKKGEIKECLQRAAIEKDPKKFYLNFISGYTTEPLYDIARKINPVVESWLQEEPLYNRGVIMLNFAGGSDLKDSHGNRNVAPNLVKTIINQNGLSY